MKTPFYIHDCDKCKYHGSFFSKEHERNYDVYTCLQDLIQNSSLILRCGNEGFDYLSAQVDFIVKEDLELFPHYKKAFEIIYGGE